VRTFAGVKKGFYECHTLYSAQENFLEVSNYRFACNLASILEQRFNQEATLHTANRQQLLQFP